MVVAAVLVLGIVTAAAIGAASEVMAAVVISSNETRSTSNTAEAAA